jgi:hypothetical protein
MAAARAKNRSICFSWLFLGEPLQSFLTRPFARKLPCRVLDVGETVMFTSKVLGFLAIPAATPLLARNFRRHSNQITTPRLPVLGTRFHERLAQPAVPAIAGRPLQCITSASLS